VRVSFLEVNRYLSVTFHERRIIMLKRVLAITFILSCLALAAFVPAGMTHAASNLQGTPLPTVIVPTDVVPTVVIPGSTAQPVVPVTGAPSFSGLIILGLIVIVALAIIVGGLALMARQSRDS
jgi:hypothetical protein